MTLDPRTVTGRDADEIRPRRRTWSRLDWAAACLMLLAGVRDGKSDDLCGVCKPTGCCEGVAYTCCPVYQREKIERKGFEVKCEPLCVPRVRLPWQDPCTPRTARVIYVHRLESASRECGEKCVLTWEPRPVCGRCGKPAAQNAPPARTPCDH